jgi:uracil-DNA glycosylase family 4
MPESIENMFHDYLQQRLELGEKVIYKPFDTEMPEQTTIEKTALSLDEFNKAESLEELYQTICECQKCLLGQSRTNFVFGDGSPDADIIFIGEAPGAEEDRLGIPFVGRAGKLLDKILAAMKLCREDVYIANILKCRPPDNRDPLPDEALTCEPYLHQQIKLIKPKIICCLGRIAAQRLLQTNMSLGQMRDRWFDYHGTVLMVTYHPAALLRSNQYTRPLWEDMQKLLKKLEGL